MSTLALTAGTHVAIFGALHRVMAAEQSLRAARARHRLMPTPRPLTSACGLAIVFPGEELGRVERALEPGPRPAELWRSDGHRYERAALAPSPAAASPEDP